MARKENKNKSETIIPPGGLDQALMRGRRMADTKPVRSLMNGRFAFFQQFLRHPLQIGSIIPSSRFLEQRILEVAGIGSAKTVVELGSGTGGTTRAMLSVMGHDARLLSIEINPQLHALISDIRDPRLTAHLGSACELEEIITNYGLEAPDAVISGIPFSTLTESRGSGVIEAVSSALAPNGCFVAYQLSGRVASLCRPVMGSGRVVVEFFNIPPMRVYRWDKRAADSVAQVQ